MAYCQGTLLRNEIEARDRDWLEAATERAAALIAEQATVRWPARFVPTS